MISHWYPDHFGTNQPADEDILDELARRGSLHCLDEKSLYKREHRLIVRQWWANPR